MRDLLPPEWRDHLEAVGPCEVAPPSDPVSALLRLAVPHEDISGVLASAPRPGTDAWWLLERCVNSLVSTMGDLADPPGFPESPAVPSSRPALPASLGPYFYVWFVFGARLADPPRRTTLERAVGDHLRAGRSWHSTVGWLPFDAPG